MASNSCAPCTPAQKVSLPESTALMCKSCTETASIIHFKEMGALCTSCFCDLIERRVRRELRALGGIAPKSHVAIIDDNSKESFVAEYIIRSIAQDMPLMITTIKPPVDKDAFDQIVIPWDADDEAVLGLRNICEGRALAFGGLKLLVCVSDAELEIFASEKGFVHPSSQFIKGPADPYTSFINATSAKYPGSVFGLARSLQEINSLRND